MFKISQHYFSTMQQSSQKIQHFYHAYYNTVYQYITNVKK
jgi:hypothetical protein